MAGDCPPQATRITEHECNLQPSADLDVIPQLSAEEVQTLLHTGYQFVDVTNSISSEQPTAQVSNDCPPDLALAALECSLSPDKMKLFETCLRYDSGLEAFNKLTDTAGHDDNILEHLPKVQPSKTAKSAQSSKGGFFVITCDEAYKSKVQKEEEKRERERKKMEKRRNQN
uniref:Uncharacterized protein LOC111123060 n=1 Tax=Crassostrea virginica TaxID=6565 RepID=A0A8B8CYH1_CRAVI|nr:uncharacterized protein LOC111123060 [Crassostrea virginica]